MTNEQDSRNKFWATALLALLAVLLIAVGCCTGCANLGRTDATKDWVGMSLCPHDAYPVYPVDQWLIPATAQHVYGGLGVEYECSNPAFYHWYDVTNYYVQPVKAIAPYSR